MFSNVFTPKLPTKMFTKFYHIRESGVTYIELRRYRNKRKDASPEYVYAHGTKEKSN